MTVDFVSIAVSESGLTAVVKEQCEDGATLPALQKVVEGYVEALDLTHPETGSIATLWLNEDGKATGKPVNEFANLLAIVSGWRGPVWGDYIVGSVALTGFNPEEGETVSLPEEWHALIARVAQV